MVLLKLPVYPKAKELTTLLPIHENFLYLYSKTGEYHVKWVSTKNTRIGQSNHIFAKRDIHSFIYRAHTYVFITTAMRA